MERAMIGITKRDHKMNEWVRKQTGIQDIVARIKQLNGNGRITSKSRRQPVDKICNGMATIGQKSQKR